MNKQFLRLLGLEEGATKQQVQEAYDMLRAKYLEERFMDGEVGNHAAKMLTKIEEAYNGLMVEFAEATPNVEEEVGGETKSDAFVTVENFIKAGNLEDAQRALDAFNERNAQWHYLQSVVFYKKNWMNESKKQLEIAIHLDPSCEKYKDAYRKLEDKISSTAQQAQSTYQGQNLNDSYGEGQMGGDFCTSCLECIACNACLNCMCNGCCH